MTDRGRAAAAATGPAPVRLETAGALPRDAGRGLARLGAAEMAALGLHPGDILRLCPPGDPGPAIHVRLLPWPGEVAGQGRIGLDEAQRASLGRALGDPVEARAAALPPAATLALVRPRGSAAPDPAALLASLEDMGVSAGETLAPALPGRSPARFRVLAVAPAPAARVTASTRIAVTAEGPAPGAPWGGIAGLDAQIARVREMVELPLRRPDLFARLGIAPPRGVLFTGPPGTGKTLLARTVARECDAAFLHLAGPEIVSKHYGESEARLRETFAEAARRAPAVIFIDEIDAIAPKREAISGEKQLERRVVGQLLTLMDGLAERGAVVVMAATNLPQALDPALRRPGRFDREIVFPVPDRAARAAILALHMKDMPLAPGLAPDEIAARTHGFTGADLAALAREAGLAALARAGAAAGGAEAVAAATLSVGPADVAEALARVAPSGLRDLRIERPETRWSDVGGLDGARAALEEAVLWPLRHAGALAALGIGPPRGLLLAGPPGAGKTLLARALAAEAEVNFVAVRATQLLGPWLGDAERAVADLFARARAAAPAILFFDELDALAPVRGAGSGAALDRLVAALLTEIDGIEDRGGVLLLAATNRPEAIDPALLRPGRFDRILRLGLPDRAARAEILAVQTRAMPLAPDVDLDRLAALTGGESGAGLARIARAAGRHAFARALRAGAATAPPGTLRVAAEDFAAALAEAGPPGAAPAATPEAPPAAPDPAPTVPKASRP